jgi:hypothetical protein
MSFVGASAVFCLWPRCALLFLIKRPEPHFGRKRYNRNALHTVCIRYKLAEGRRVVA